MEGEFDVLIVGGGFCGTVLAANLVRAHSHLRVAIADPADAGEFGPAYRTACPLHLLNAPASAMSAFPGDPSHFLTWANDEGQPLEPGSFAERSLYRRYLASIWKEVQSSGRVSHVQQLVSELARTPRGWAAKLVSGNRIDSRSVVLAFGVERPRQIGNLAHPAYVSDLWSHQELNVPRNVSQVGVIGSGLTAVDAVLAVESQGVRPSYTVISRHGQLPAVHGPRPSSLPAPPEPSESISTLTRRFRSAVQNDKDWRALIDAMRPTLPGFWKQLSAEDRSRFLRHVRPYWDTHRHRMPPQVASRLEELLVEGRLQVRAERVAAVRPEGETLRMEFASGQSVVVDLLINCAGPPPVSEWESPLLRQLVSAGAVRIDPLDLGLECDDAGNAAPGLYLLGMLRKGQEWESTAVRELSVQAVDLANALVAPASRRISLA